MPATYRRKYGLDWPVAMHDALIELVLWKKYREYPFNQSTVKDPWECFFRANEFLLTREQFIRSRWTEEHVYDWTTEKFCITWGCASACKSNDYGLMAVEDWMVDPTLTYTLMASTTKEGLKLRVFESVVRYFKILKHSTPFLIPGKLSKTMTAIINDDDADEFATSKAGIRGVAVDEGTEDEARGKLRGGHLPYARLILDELSQMRPAAMSVKTNMAIGAKDFRLFGLTNIDSLYDLAGQYSVPDHPDKWKSVGPDTPEWRTQWGKVRRHDGLLSPAIVEPGGAEKYPHLLNQATLDELIRQEGGNIDAPQIWVQVRAWPPGEGKSHTVITEAEIAQWKMHNDVEWEGPVTNIAGLDPAFVSGGNACVYQPAQVGFDTSGVLVIRFGPTHVLKIEASSATPALFQVYEQARALSDEYKVIPSYLGVDDSATQSVADVLDRMWQPGCLRVQFGGKPSESPVSEVNAQRECDRYRDQVTALWYAMREYGQAGQIRNLPTEAARQITRRRVKKPTVPLQLVTKQEFAKDIHRSPDEADACAIVLAVVKHRLGILPGANKQQPKGAFSRMLTREYARRLDLDSSPYAYAQEAV